jgi:hypothetical protein
VYAHRIERHTRGSASRQNIEEIGVFLGEETMQKRPGKALRGKIDKNRQKTSVFSVFFFTRVRQSRMIGLTKKRSNISALFCFCNSPGAGKRM